MAIEDCGGAIGPNTGVAIGTAFGPVQTSVDYMQEYVEKGAALGNGVPVSSTKSFFGHTLGAAGGVEAVISVLALLNQTAPPTLRLTTAAADCSLDYIPHTPRPMAMRSVLSNTFGFGGSNVSLLFKRAEMS
ncbi:MAG TPA: hypothetical protein VF057_01695, partial [Thermoanaerobaculia bacterium]